MTYRSSVSCRLERRGWARLSGLVLSLSLVLVWGCSTPVARVGVRPFYRPAPLPEGAVEVRREIAYRDDSEADPEKHRLDLYLPPGKGWPTLLFVHGGSLEGGDKDKRLAGYDIYGNIGRFYSARGVGVALVNYRLQPEVQWADQVDDVAAATAWVLEHIREYGGDGRVFASGHSAGAWLSARVALDETSLHEYGFDGNDLAGVISISGSGFDMTDERTWEMFGRERRWARRFAVEEEGVDWRVAASVVPLLKEHDPRSTPPFLLLYSSREWEALGRQNQLLYEAMTARDMEVELIAVPTDGHRRNVLALSRPDRELPRHVIAFMEPIPAGSIASPPNE